MKLVVCKSRATTTVAVPASVTITRTSSLAGALAVMVAVAAKPATSSLVGVRGLDAPAARWQQGAKRAL